MVIVDVIILLILAGFIFHGLYFGLIKAVGSLLGFVIGLWIAINFYLVAYEWSKFLFFGHVYAGKIACFIIVYALANRLIALGVDIINKLFNILSIIPFLKTINRLGGAVLGFIEGGFVLGFALYTLTSNILLNNIFSRYVEQSEFTPFLVRFGKAIAPMIPEVLNKLKDLI